ncbi:TAP42-like protein, partial [Gaertneriomyces semiglobifer]
GGSLRDDFDRAEKLFSAIQSGEISGGSQEYQNAVNDAIRLFEQCEVLVRRLSIFSSNEILDDIHTTDLRYLLTPAYLAELHSLRCTTSQSRLQSLRTSLSYYQTFFSTLEQHEIPPFAPITSDASPSSAEYKWFQVVQQTLQTGEDSTANMSAAERRNMKVEQHKKEKELKLIMKDLEQRWSAMQDSEDGKRTSTTMEVDETTLRDMVLTSIRLLVHQALTNVPILVAERELLKKAPPRRSHENAKADDSATLSQRRSQMPTSGPLLDHSGKILRPFTLSTRSAIQQKVFGYSHNLPTMSVEEYLELEMQRGNILSGGGNVPDTSERVRNAEDRAETGDDTALEDERRREVDWDEFKDWNPKGVGNRYNKG